jgi:hypothetical protein
VIGDRRARFFHVAAGILPTELCGFLDRIAARDVSVERIVGRRLVGNHVDGEGAASDLGEDVGRVALDADRDGSAGDARLLGAVEGDPDGDAPQRNALFSFSKKPSSCR